MVKPSLFFISSLSFPTRPSFLISAALYTHGRHSLIEFLLPTNLCFCWLISCMLWCLRLFATAALPGRPSSSRACQTRKMHECYRGATVFFVKASVANTLQQFKMNYHIIFQVNVGLVMESKRLSSRFHTGSIVAGWEAGVLQ